MDLNTSHVNVNRIISKIKRVLRYDLNTSHVNVNQYYEMWSFKSLWI